MSQGALARACCLDKSLISYIEKGTRGVTRQAAIALADGLTLHNSERLWFLSLAGVLEQPLTRRQALFITVLAWPEPEVSFTCPECGRVAYHPDDIKMRHCPACRRTFEREKGDRPWFAAH